MTGTLIIVVFAVLAGGLILVLKNGKSAGRNAAKNKKPVAAAKAVPTEYHAVSIKAGKISCGAATVLSGKRYLSNAAPRLPLDGCDSAECGCLFVHHKDRRSSEDRRNPFGSASGGGTTGTYPQERRSAKERRAEPPGVHLHRA